ncbi:hypothetical protein OG799_14595 [Micromonospora sp. NBC_00898]|uniref:hypothetical protein n=1 Tax=Micromonospora sp. NBC_00898 TaxID=2975981 RepID=UPI00386E7A54|nr:hypothetical protein OG799_14595 [Micromonospora sp. NBC_00898]
MRVHPRHPDPGAGGQVLEPAGCRVPVHPRSEVVAEDRAVDAVVDRTVHGPGHRGWQRDEDDLAAFAAYPHDAVSVFLAEVADVGAAGVEDPQPEQAEHGDQREVVRVGRSPRGGDPGLELEVAQPEGG